jgi:hypothetical protein
MNKTLKRNIIKALIERRKELYAELAEVNDVLMLYRPPLRAVEAPPEETMNARIMEHVSNDWQTSLEIAHKTGISRLVVARRLNKMAAEKRLICEKFRGIPHYRSVPEKMRIKVGEGIIRSKR